MDITFSILEENSPSLLSNKDMLENGLDISLQGSFLYVGDRLQPLTMKNFFSVHRWNGADTLFGLFTESDLRRIHKTFGHPSVPATHMLLQHAKKEPLQTRTKNGLIHIKEYCAI